MALILNIDTAINNASVGLCENGQMLAMRESNEQKEHASFLHVAIKAILDELALQPAAVDAVAITSGPGSYTGLRVGMAAAKGWCYALNKPLIAINTLKVMAFAGRQYLESTQMVQKPALLCPMIDARRMEVFTAIYDFDLNLLLKPAAIVLVAGAFEEWLNSATVFFGNGCEKLKPLQPNAHYIQNFKHSVKDLGLLSLQAFNNLEFSDLAYLEPEYLKDFYTITRQQSV